MNQAYHLLVTFVRQVQQGLYWRRLFQGGVLLLTLLLALLLLGVGVQQLIPVAPFAVPVYSVLAVLVVLAVLAYVVRPMLRVVSRHQALQRIEETYPALHDDLTNAVQLDPVALARSNPHGMALDLVAALHQQTAQRLKSCTPAAAIKQGRLFGLSWCGLLVLTTVLVAFIQPQSLQLSWRMLVQPWSFLPPREMHIALAPEHAVIAHGTSLEVQAQVQGRIPRRLQMHIKPPGAPDVSYAMEPLQPGVFRYTFIKPQTSFTFHATAGSFTSPAGTVEVVPAPAVGHIALHYLFPAYTGLPERQQEGGGDIQALPGTRVRLHMRANVAVRKGVLRFASGQELPLHIAGETLQGELLVMREDSYVVEIEDTHGLKNLHPPRYTVHVLPDQVPAVTLLAPQDGHEVDEMTALQIRYKAEDDFGLQDASLVYFGANGTEQRVPIVQGRLEHRQVQETFTWDMHQWPLPDGESVQVYVEVYDNDTIAGPKRGVSETLTLTIRSRAQEHQELEALQEELADAVLDLLADHLEMAAEMESLQEAQANSQDKATTLQNMQEQQQRAMEQVENVAQQLEEALSRVQQDPYSTYDTYANLQALQHNMAQLQNTLLPSMQQSMQELAPPMLSSESLKEPAQKLENVVREFERLASLAEQVASGEKLNDLTRLSTKMMDQQNALLAALDNLPKDFQGGELPPELQELLDALQNMMQELMQAAAQLPASLTDEFLNRQLDSLPLSDMAQQLQELREKLAAGDLEGARQLAAELLKAMSSMVAALQNMQQQAGSGPMDALGQQLQESTNRLAELVERQERLFDATQQIDQETIQALNALQQQAFDAAQARLEQELLQLGRQARELLRQGRQQPAMSADFQEAYRQLSEQLRALQNDLKERNIPQVMADLEQAAQQLAWMQQQVQQLPGPETGLPQQAQRAMQHLQTAQRILRSLPQDRQAMLTPEQRGQLGELGGQQGRVRDDAHALHQELEQMLPLMPFLPTEIAQQLQEAIPFMGQAEGELRGRRSQEAIPPEQQALERLRSAQNAMQQAMQAMAQRGQMMGMSMPMLRQAGRLPMPGMMPQPQVNDRQDGMAGVNVRNFQLPAKEAYKVPRMFREDIAEALRSGYPERYKELIEQYYRDIVR